MRQSPVSSTINESGGKCRFHDDEYKHALIWEFQFAF